MLAEVPEDKRNEASKYLKAVQDGLKKVQGAIDLKWVQVHKTRAAPGLCRKFDKKFMLSSVILGLG